MTFRIVSLCALGFFTAAQAIAQGAPGPGPGRVFRIHQWSWWAADGLPAGEVVARDSTFLFRPDSARGWPATGMVPAEFELGEHGGLSVTLVVRPQVGIEAVLVSAEEARCGSDWADGSTSALAALVLALLQPLDSLGEQERPLPRLTFGACDDTVVTEFARSLRPWPPDSSGHETRYVQVRGTITAVWGIERNLTSGGSTARASFRGWVSGTVRPDQGGMMGALDLSGRFRGAIVFEGPDGRLDTVFGTWVTELSGGWIEDPALCRQRAFQYFVQHGRDGPHDCLDEATPNPYLALAVRVGDEPMMADSLVKLRLVAADPKERARLEAALAAAFWNDRSEVARALLGTPARIAPFLVLDAARYSAIPHDTARFSRAVALILARELAPLAIQRRRLTNREELGADVVGVLGEGRGFLPEAGQVLEAAAREADDPMSRDLLLFAAYQADPARYRSVVEATVDSIRGYGPIVRAWLEGADLTNWSWGLERAAHDSVARFPGVDAAPDQLEDFFGPAMARTAVAPLVMRFAADGRDLTAELRKRFASDTSFALRRALLPYFLAAGDTTASPWLRALLSGPTNLREVAYDYLPPDTARDAAVIAELQRMVLGYIAGLETIRDTAGSAVDPPYVHDERPDQRILVSEGVLLSAIEPWRRRFEVMTIDSVNARARAEGLQMAWVLDPILQTGERFYLEIALVPVGAQCLCGGGVRMALERRNGRWVAVSMGSWIS